MEILLQIIYTVLVLGALIFIHEFGHFITAKLSGVKVNEFALGMGPTLFKIQGKETKYALISESAYSPSLPVISTSNLEQRSAPKRQNTLCPTVRPSKRRIFFF